MIGTSKNCSKLPAVSQLKHFSGGNIGKHTIPIHVHLYIMHNERNESTNCLTFLNLL